MDVADLYESLARDRHRYERLVLSRMGTAISREDAEDIVSDSLLRLQAKTADPPQRGKEDAWFARIVLNQGIDFLRARDGRKREGSAPRPIVVALSDIDEDLRALANGDEDGDGDIAALADKREREQVQALVTRVMDALEPKDAELVKLRHLVGAHASRDQVATMAGLTVGEFRWRYARAWGRFVDAVADDAPTPRCRHIRQLFGEVEAGTAPTEAVAEIDAHTLDCASCRVFARESYRALELLPFVPVFGIAERWSVRIGWWWERSGPETTAGAGTAAAGAGAAGLMGGGGAAGLAKALAVVCSATAVTAGVCAGVATVINDLSERDRQPQARTPKPALRAETTPTPTPAPTATPAASKPKRRSSDQQSRADTSGRSQIPGAAPAGASEFSPTASTAAVDPAPATSSGGGEFSP